MKNYSKLFFVLVVLAFMFLPSVSFASSSATSTLAMVSPNGGEVFKKGLSYNLIWDSATTSTSSVFLKLQSATGTTTNIATVNPDNGSYMWTVPTTTPTGQYKVGVFSNATTSDFSDDFFSIVSNSDSDVNHDGSVNGTDLGLVLGAFGRGGYGDKDINKDGIVDGEDLSLLLSSWGPLP